MEAKYLTENLSCLMSCLKEVAEKRPHDPIEYIAFWLKKHIENERYKSKKAEEAEQYEKLKVEEAIIQERKVKRLEEARRFAQEEAERLKALEQERKAREAASVSKLSIVEERDEHETSKDVSADEKVDEIREDEEEEHAAEGEVTEKNEEKVEKEEGDLPEEATGEGPSEDAKWFV